MSLFTIKTAVTTTKGKTNKPMPASNPQRNKAPASPAAEEAKKAAAKRFRLEYRRPWLIFYPAAASFIVLNYLAFCTTTDEAGTTRLLPGYIVSYAETRGTTSFESVMCNVLLFFEEKVMGSLYQLGVLLFRSLFGIQMVCVGAWLIHFFEIGMCARICFSCNATAGTTALSLLCTTLAGFAQLVPLTSSRDAWVAKVKKAASEEASDTAAQKSKKAK